MVATVLGSLIIAIVTQSGNPAPDCRGVPAANAPSALPNDNRAPAGTMKDGVLTVRLVARAATWRPEGAQGCGLPVFAFAEEGKAAQIPGPLIRVPVGTQVRVILRNELGESIRIRGLHERVPEWRSVGAGRAQLFMDSSAVEITGDTEREFRFRATLPGNFYYWGRRSAADSGWRRNPGRLKPDLSGAEDGQLVGALVVDPEDGSPPDRVLVLTHWRFPGTRSTEDPGTARELNAINGLSWPHSERLSATVGDTLRWSVLNPASTSHVMHLHGFYYRILSRGGVSAYDSVLTLSQQESVVSEFMAPNRTMTIEWVPEKPGNWLFHCHFLVHMSPAQSFARVFGPAKAGQASAHADHASSGMAGPMVGITVKPAGGTTADALLRPLRQLRLFANERPRVFGDLPGLGFVLQSGTTAPASDSIRIPGTPIILTRGEPTQITVFNRLRVPLGVHWHGIELASYFDGVPEFSGSSGRTMAAMQPGDSFAVHMTPPRAGTFIYHVHSEEFDELNSGLYGPLIVLESAQSWDPERDHTFVISNGGPGDSHKTIFVNGSATPAPIEMRVGVTHRLRFIAIPANGEFVVRLLDANTPVTWRQVARDGADLPSAQIVQSPARTRVDVGNNEGLRVHAQGGGRSNPRGRSTCSGPSHQAAGSRAVARVRLETRSEAGAELRCAELVVARSDAHWRPMDAAER